MSDWNPRYLAYCRATGGLSPDETRARDGSGARYIVWTGERWREWYGVIGYKPECLGAAEHAAFDAWLEAATGGASRQGAPLIIRRRARSRDVRPIEEYLRTGDSPQARAGLARSNRAKLERHERTWGLLAPVVEAPELDTLQARVERQNAWLRQRRQEERDQEARDWRRARARLREISRERAVELVEAWNARGRWSPAGAVDLLVFLDMHEPTPERIEERRRAREQSREIHRRHASWWIEHRGCVGLVDRHPAGLRLLRCDECGREWKPDELESAEASGELVMVRKPEVVQTALIL